MNDSKTMHSQKEPDGLRTETVEIVDLSRSGSGVARQAGGRVIFVPFTATGDEVRVEILTESKRYAEGRVLEVVKRSPHRVDPPCPVFEKCGGCQWQHLPYAIQWQTKQRGVEHALERLKIQALLPGVTERPALMQWNYRNRIQLRGNAQAQGFYAPKSHEIIPIDQCAIARTELNAVLGEVRAEGLEKLRAQSAAARSSSENTGEALGEYKVEVEVLPNGQVRKIWNARHGAAGFRQVHDEQNAQLQTLVADWLLDSMTGPSEKPLGRRQGRILLDLFGGAGNLSLGIASRFESVDCVDFGTPPASTLAESRPDGFEFHRGGVLPWLRRMKRSLEAQGLPISVVLDPPRTGIGCGSPEDAQAIVNLLTHLPVTEIVAVGCDVDAWSHDLVKFTKAGWRVERIAALDLFPQTPHVEAIARLIPSSRSSLTGI